MNGMRTATGSLALAAALVVVALSSTGVLAQKTINATWGWVVARNPSMAHYTPSAADRGNSSGGINTVDRASVGQYVVHMPGLESSGAALGIAHATAMGSKLRICIVGEWDSGGTEQTVDVRCYKPDGSPADSQFSVNFLQASGVSGRIAYAWAEDPTFPGSYTPNSNYNYDSMGGLVSVNHNAIGHYRVTMPHLAAHAGHVQVTANFAPATCKVVSWGPSAADELVNVACRDLTGAMKDTQFSITFVQGTGLKGPGPKHQAYLLADRPTTASYHPTAAYRFSTSGQAATVQRAGTGRYVATLPGQPLGGGAEVTTYGQDGARCQISGIRTSSGPAMVGVACYGANGSLKDDRFTLAWAR